MNYVLIAGAHLSGKSTLAERMVELGGLDHFRLKDGDSSELVESEIGRISALPGKNTALIECPVVVRMARDHSIIIPFIQQKRISFARGIISVQPGFRTLCFRMGDVSKIRQNELSEEICVEKMCLDIARAQSVPIFRVEFHDTETKNGIETKPSIQCAATMAKYFVGCCI